MTSLWDAGMDMDADLTSITPPQPGAPKIAMVSPDRIVTTDRVQTYNKMPAPVRPWHALANWTSVSWSNNPNRPTVNER